MSIQYTISTNPASHDFDVTGKTKVTLKNSFAQFGLNITEDATSLTLELDPRGAGNLPFYNMSAGIIASPGSQYQRYSWRGTGAYIYTDVVTDDNGVTTKKIKYISTASGAIDYVPSQEDFFAIDWISYDPGAQQPEQQG